MGVTPERKKKNQNDEVQCYNCGNFFHKGFTESDPYGNAVCRHCSDLRYRIGCELTNRWILDRRVWKWKATADHQAKEWEANDPMGYRVIVLEVLAHDISYGDAEASKELTPPKQLYEK